MKWIKSQRHTHWHSVRSLCRFCEIISGVGAMSSVRFKSERLLLFQMDWGYDEHSGCVNDVAVYSALYLFCSNRFRMTELVRWSLNETSKMSFGRQYILFVDIFMSIYNWSPHNQNTRKFHFSINQSRSIDIHYEFELLLVDSLVIWPPKLNTNEIFSSNRSWQWSNLNGTDILNASWICIRKQENKNRNSIVQKNWFKRDVNKKKKQTIINGVHRL